MASTKELFRKGIGYLKYDIKQASAKSVKYNDQLSKINDRLNNITDDIACLADDLIYFKKNLQADMVDSTQKELNRLQVELHKLKEYQRTLQQAIKGERGTIRKAYDLLNHFQDEYSYTDDEIDEIACPTDDELESDYKKDIKEAASDEKTWTADHTAILLQRARELDMLKDKKLIPLDDKTGRPITGDKLTAFLADKLTPLPN